MALMTRSAEVLVGYQVARPWRVFWPSIAECAMLEIFCRFRRGLADSCFGGRYWSGWSCC
jgi:hypothetical protein